MMILLILEKKFTGYRLNRCWIQFCLSARPFLDVQEGEDDFGDLVQVQTLFRQERDEVLLEHWLEKSIESAVLGRLVRW